MKVSPIASGGTPGVNLTGNIGSTASPERLAAAKAIAAGQTLAPQPETLDESKVEKNIRRIKMLTQRSTNRDDEILAAEAIPAELEVPVSTNQATNVQAEPVVEATQPISPQFAALAKQKRALQVKERELAEREKALSAQAPSESEWVKISDLKASPLGVMRKHDITYDQLTQEILNNPENAELTALRAEVKAMKEGFDKTLSDRDTQAETAALDEMCREARALSEEGEKYELIREERAIPQVRELIRRIYKSTGEVLDVEEAMGLVEEELLKDNLKRAGYGKIKSKFQPSQQAVQQQAQKPVMRTLTNRDNAQPLVDRRARAIAAFYGK